MKELDKIVQECKLFSEENIQDAADDLMTLLNHTKPVSYFCSALTQHYDVNAVFSLVIFLILSVHSLIPPAPISPARALLHSPSRNS